MNPRQLLAHRLENDFRAFVKQAWPVLHPTRELVWDWPYDLLCEYLTLLAAGKIKRLIINIPPRCLKSSLISILLPVWRWCSQPEHNFLAASYSLDLSHEHSIARRGLLVSPWYQRLWGHKFQLAPDRNQVGQFANTRNGQMVASSVGGTLMGKGADLIVVDDPTTPDQALSDTERNSANRWFDTTLRTRLNDPALGKIVVVMQRLHERDLTGHLLEREPGVWTHLLLPSVAEETERWTFPISGWVVERPRGEALLARRFPPETVEELRSRRLVFAGQYQQRPAPAEGNLIKCSEVRYYGGIDPKTGLADEKLPDHFDRKVISVDCAFKDVATSDYVAIVVIGVKGRKRYVLNVVNRHLDAAATEAEIRRQRELYYPCAVIIEDKANGPAVIQRLKLNVSGVIEINPEGGKVARMYAAAPEWQAGDWYVDRNAAWTGPFVEQLTSFPNGAHDDMADAMCREGELNPHEG